MAQDSATIHITFRGNLRGSSPFPFYVENTRGTAVTTNLETGAPSPRSSPAPATTTPSSTTATAR